MISQPNPLQQLSGSKYITNFFALIALFVLLSSMAACSLFQSGTSSSREDRRTVVLEPEDDGKAASDAERKDADARSMDTLRAPIPADPGRRNTIALLLPFSLDQKSLDQLKEQNPAKRNRPLVSLGIYEGALIAIDSLRARGAFLDLLVYDTRNSAEEVRNITSKPEFAQVDLIIGPLFEAELQEATSYARRKGIPIVSPIRKISGQQRHPGFYALQPGEEEIFRLLGASLQDSERRSRIILLHQDLQDEKALASYFLQGFSDTMRRSKVQELISDYRMQGLNEALSSVQPNVLVVPSRNEVFVSALTRKVSELNREFEVKVFGLEDWKKFESIAPERFNRINFHYPTHYWPGANGEHIEHFDRVYRERFYTPPGDYAYLGFDMMLYFGQMLQRNGPSWPELMRYPTHFAGMNDQFKLQAVDGGSKSADHHRNELLHLIRYDQDRFVLAR